MADAPDAPARTFALLSPCGHGNLGDAATVEAALQNIRRRVPGARFVGITLRPDDTESRHGIPSFPMGAISRPMYGIVGAVPAAAAAAPGSGDGAPAAQAAPSAAFRALRSAGRALLPRGWARNARHEARHLRAAYALARSVDMVVLPGGGQLDDFFGGPWGQPYALMKWALLARLSHARVAMLCVGFGTLKTWQSRFFTRIALRLSRYRSYRDAGSKELMSRAGFRRDDPVLPDLAFSLDVSRRAEPAPPGRVCISPMVYRAPGLWPDPSEAAYRRYFDSLLAVAVQLVEHGNAVVLAASDSSDQITVRAMHAALSECLGGRLDGRVHVPAVSTVDAFLEEVSRCRFLIASRLHGVVLSHLAGTPAIALAYDRKVKAHMMLIGQSEYCIEVETFLPSQVLAMAQAVQNGADRIGQHLRDKGDEFRRRLDAQYDSVLAGR